MEQPSLISCYVARGTVILTEYTEYSKESIFFKVDRHMKYCLVEDGFTFCVVAIDYVSRQIPNAFLERVKEDFNKRYGGGKAETAVANSLNKEFGPKLREHMRYCIDHSEEISKLTKVNPQVTEVKVMESLNDPEEIRKFTKVKSQVAEVKGVMEENIKKAADRGVVIHVLMEETGKLQSQHAMALNVDVATYFSLIDMLINFNNSAMKRS